MIKVMIAEDIPLVREYVVDKINHNAQMEIVGEAGSGREILALVNESVPDVILMDIEMETNSDGLDAAKEILRSHPGVRIVFLTVHNENDLILSSFLMGAVSYVLKTSTGDEIVQAVLNAHKGVMTVQADIADRLRNEFSSLEQNKSDLKTIVNTLAELTKTEKEIIRYLLEGKKTREIAEKRFVEEVTVKSQIAQLRKKFNQKRTKDLIAFINRLNLTEFF